MTRLLLNLLVAAPFFAIWMRVPLEGGAVVPHDQGRPAGAAGIPPSARGH
jgi:hypothetical protein